MLIDEEGNEVDDYWAKLQSLETRTTLHAWAKRRGQVDRFSPLAPLGRYRLRIEPGLRPASAFREVVQNVVIVANDAVLRVTLASAGLFRFRVRVEGKEDEIRRFVKGRQ